MSFRYVNPGYGELIPRTSSFICYTEQSITKNPENGVVIYTKTKTSGSAYEQIPVLTDKFESEVYGRFDVYSRDKYSGVGLYFGSKATYFYAHISSLYVNLDTGQSFSIISNVNHSVSFHYKLADGEGSGLLEVTVDDTAVASLNHSVTTADNTIRLYLGYGNGDACIGNIILSDEYISPKEEVIILPTSGVETDMTDNGDGTYTASEAGQTLLQTVDASDLITKYGRSSKLTSLAVAGVPAYNATGALSLVGIDKIAGTVTEHDKVAVGSSDSVGAIDLWKTNMTVGKLDGKQVGWKAAT